MSKQAAGLDYTVSYTLSTELLKVYLQITSYFSQYLYLFLTGCLQKVLHAQKYSFLIISAKMP